MAKHIKNRKDPRLAYSYHYFPYSQAAAFLTVIARIEISSVKYSIALMLPSRNLEKYEPPTITIVIEHPYVYSENGNGGNGENGNGKNGKYVASFLDKGDKGSSISGLYDAGASL